ncbi:hypothetical protein F5Y11DRAFT_314412 [Daldinia sp. FL1419]|nr:hypothetical protein F5Y11DRAFT_314412 [Daldinia sp. FL1419]
MGSILDEIFGPGLPILPVILSLQVDEEGDFESEYRLRLGKEVKYITIFPGTFDAETLSFPLPVLPDFPDDVKWNVAHISRDPATDEVTASLWNRTLPGVQCRWRRTVVNCLELVKTKQLGEMAFETRLPRTLARSIFPNALSSVRVVGKIASFEWEIPPIEKETRAYQLLEGSGLAPRFLAHVREGRRIIGFLLEKLEGRTPSFQDLSICEAALRKLHGLGYAHGDVSPSNFLITEDGEVKLLDFEQFQESIDSELMEDEVDSLRSGLMDESGYDGGIIYDHDDEE